MRIAYVNTDEVNKIIAARLARKFGAVIHEIHPNDLATIGKYDAVLYNLDDVPRHRQRDVLADVIRGLRTCPKAVHGYDLSEEQAGSLRLSGVAVAQRLRRELFRILLRTVVQKLASVPPDDALAEDTWIDLAQQPAASHFDDKLSWRR